VRIEIMACAAPEVAPAAAPEAAPAKRPRGRPPKAATFDGPALAPAVAKRPRGRPPGMTAEPPPHCHCNTPMLQARLVSSAGGA